MNDFIDDQDEDILDNDDNNEDVASIVYDITSYGVDYDVDGLVKRLRRGDIIIPPFQRDYVWNQAEASRLVESLLLGLPVPGIFLAKEPESSKLLVIDGQQRLKTLQFFFDGYFNPREGDTRRRIFKLDKVQKQFQGKTYQDLIDSDRMTLDDSTIHATVIKQESPNEDNTSIYHVFERLNTGGRKLTPQEIRVAIYMGDLNNMIVDLNDTPSWRQLFGKKNNRLKDQELILRFFAMYTGQKTYQKPMKEFLNKFNLKYKNASVSKLENLRNIFIKTADTILRCLGVNAFRPDRVFNTSAYDALMVGVANLLSKGIPIDESKLKISVGNLFKNKEFLESITRATSDESVVLKRQKLVDSFIN
jgi:uncharacterized protein with ParB-like and HNH nuclease domain